MVQEPRHAVADRREKPRKQVLHTFRVSHPSFGEWECRTRDLSLSGAFVEGRFSDIVPGDTLYLSFSPAAGVSMEHRFSAAVVRVDAMGVGLKFLSLDMDTYGALLDLTLQV